MGEVFVITIAASICQFHLESNDLISEAICSFFFPWKTHQENH